MVKSRKTSKFVIDLGPEIDKVVKKKNAKIRKQRVIIAELQDKLHNKTDDMKVKKQKLIITSLQGTIDELAVERFTHKESYVSSNCQSKFSSFRTFASHETSCPFHLPKL
jgi:hypothetical protein